MNVTAIVVTRGDVDLSPIIGQDWPEQVQEIIVWDNSSLDRRDLKVYGRYAAIAEASHPLILVQDDDCVLPKDSIQQMLDAYSIISDCPQHGETELKTVKGHTGWVCDKHEPKVFSSDALVSNMPAAFRGQPLYASGECALVGFGAAFHRDAPKRAFEKAGLVSEGYIDTNSAIDIGPGSADFFRRECDVVFTGLTPRVYVDVEYRDLPWAHAENRLWKQPEHVSERMRMLELVRKVRDAN